MSDIEKRIQQVVDELVDSGTESGLQVAVYRDGDQVADAVAGVADVASRAAVGSATPYFVASVGKGVTATVVHVLAERVTATVVHVLAERGVLDYDTPIAELWPEFGAHGKDRATIRHALTHRTGVPGLPVDTTPADLADWSGTCAAIAAAKPWWEPGTTVAYHAQTYGHILGEVVRRATGKPISQVLREEVAEPLGIADELYFGVPAGDLPRLARLEERPPPPGAEDVDLSDLPMFRVVDGYTAAPMATLPTAEFCNRPEVLTADIPAGGTMSARAVARMYAALISPVDGVRLLPPDRLAEVTALAANDHDEVLGMPLARGLGYDLGYPTAALPDPQVFGGAGACGSAVYTDPATGTTIALNKTTVSYGDFTAFRAVAEAVG